MRWWLWIAWGSILVSAFIHLRSSSDFGIQSRCGHAWIQEVGIICMVNSIEAVINEEEHSEYKATYIMVLFTLIIIVSMCMKKLRICKNYTYRWYTYEAIEYRRNCNILKIKVNIRAMIDK